MSNKNKKENDSEDFSGLGLTLVFLFLVLSLTLVLGLKDEIYLKLFIVFYIIGAILGGVIGYQQIQLNKGTTPSPPPSTYQGTVEAIYTNNPSSITFTSGERWTGNISRVSNLSIGAICKLIQNVSISQQFDSGTCTK